jgi:CrcB protein
MGMGVPPITAVLADDSYQARERRWEHVQMTPQLIFAVAAGGALGSAARYLVGVGSGKLFGTDFPLGTLIINVTGSFLMGLFVGLFAVKWDLSQAVRAFLTVGICGGYTTFSTFSLDAYFLIERGEVVASFAYIVGSVALSVGALIAALRLVRAFGKRVSGAAAGRKHPKLDQTGCLRDQDSSDCG